MGKNHRKSYWLGDHAQAVQTSGMTMRRSSTGEIIDIPTDYVIPYEFPERVLQLKSDIESQFNVSFNSCLVGLFDNSRDKIGFHDDSCSSMGEDPFIGSVSLGRSRKFRVKSKATKKVIEIILEHGDLLVMRENANRKYRHAVPADLGCTVSDPRLNLTFRNYNYDSEE